MRYLSANEMKDMPEGTIFFDGGYDEVAPKFAFNEVMIFRGNMKRSENTGSWDWDEECLFQIDADSSTEAFEKELSMIDGGQSVPLSPGASFQRHALYPREAYFWVLEPADMLRLQKYILDLFGAVTAGMSSHEKLVIQAEAE